MPDPADLAGESLKMIDQRWLGRDLPDRMLARSIRRRSGRTGEREQQHHQVEV